MGYVQSKGLVKIGSYVFPVKYIQLNSYSAKENTLYKNTFTDADGYTSANAISHKINKITFKTIPMTNAEFDTIMSNIVANYADNDFKPRMSKASKSFWCEFYNPESALYVTAGCHLTDLDISIDRIEESTGVIHYNPITFTITVW